MLVYNGDKRENSIHQNLVNDAQGSLLEVSISSMSNNQFLTYHSTNHMWVNTSLNESKCSKLSK